MCVVKRNGKVKVSKHLAWVKTTPTFTSTSFFSTTEYTYGYKCNNIYLNTAYGTTKQGLNWMVNIRFNRIHMYVHYSTLVASLNSVIPNYVRKRRLSARQTLFSGEKYFSSLTISFTFAALHFSYTSFSQSWQWVFTSSPPPSISFYFFLSTLPTLSLVCFFSLIFSIRDEKDKIFPLLCLRDTQYRYFVSYFDAYTFCILLVFILCNVFGIVL
jgi:hypothetical protein